MTAQGAGSAASSFELTLAYRQVDPWWLFPDFPHEGTFAARAPFCRSGTVVRVGAAEHHRFTCDDGSGSLVVTSADVFPWVDPYPWSTHWEILEGTGSYGAPREGVAVYRDERGSRGDRQLAEHPSGIAAEDAVAPTIGFSSVEVTKLRRPAGAYSLGLAIALRDDVEGSSVSYVFRVTPTTSARELAGSVGTTQAGTVSTTLRVDFYRPRARAVLLHLTASDEVGNESSVSRVVMLPR